MISHSVTRAIDLARMIGRALMEATLPAGCPVCTAPLVGHRAGVCGACWWQAGVAAAAEPPGRPVSHLTVLGPYEGRLRDIIGCLKFGDMPALGTYLGELLAGRLGDGFDVIVPVPLHWTRRWRRGYNQAKSIADGIGRARDRPVMPRMLGRRRMTAAQTGRTRRERVANVTGAFRAVPGSLSGARVLLVDDVVTTGATLRECARVLRNAGAGDVQAAAAARTRVKRSG